MKVLIIEDDMQIAELQRDYLEMSGFETEIATNGTDGLKSAKSDDLNLIILDIMLPGVDGFEICRQIRSFSRIPILFVSAKVDDIDKIRGLGLGADDYMVKPFSPSELVARVKAHISRYDQLTEKTHSANDEITIRGLYVNISTHTVKLNGSEIYMPPKEFDLLCYLMQNPGKIFSKEQLLNKIWGINAFVEPATVAVHINRLREKLEKNPSNPTYIETIWGLGYKFMI